MPYPNTNNNKKKYPWMAQVIINGKKRRKQSKTKREAREWEDEQKLSPSEEILSTSLLEWGTKYLEYSKKEFVHKTFMEKKKAFVELFKNNEISPDDAVEGLTPYLILEHLQEQDDARSGNAANKDRKNLSAAWKWGVKYLKLPFTNPIAITDKFAEDRHERRMPSLDEFDAVFDVTSEGQDKTMLWTYFQTGARREELFRLQWKDVDFKEKKVRLYWRKNKKGQWRDAWLPVKDELMSLLKAHQKVTGFKTFVFLNFNGSDEPQYWVPYQYRQHWLKNLCEKAGVEKFGFHGIRHLFASTLAAENVPLVEIQYMLRHKNLTTTQRYIHRLKKENREVLEALPDLRNEKKSPLKAHQG